MAAAEESGERTPLVATSLENDIGTVTLNNSKKHNAISAALIADLLEAGQKLNASGVKVVILRAAPGVKVWSAGHDVNELPTNGLDPLTYDDPLRQVVRAIHETRMPVVAMVEGSARRAEIGWAVKSISLRIGRPTLSMKVSTPTMS
jgi:methylmalonyl-CoA decarboxylase